MGHIRLKPTRELKINFDPSELIFTKTPAESKKKAKEFIDSKKLSQDDIMLMLEGKVIFGYDYLHEKKKIILPEVNPITVFYSNAIMSYGMLDQYRKKMLDTSYVVGKEGKFIDLNHSGDFFHLAINCIINLQAALESFANRIIPENFLFINKTGNTIQPTVSHKLFNALPKIKGIDFKIGKHRKYVKCIDSLIKLRNDIVHLRPVEDTNTGYKYIYRDLLSFDFQKALLSVKIFINFYEDGLIEECSCEQDFFFDVVLK